MSKDRKLIREAARQLIKEFYVVSQKMMLKHGMQNTNNIATAIVEASVSNAMNLLKCGTGGDDALARKELIALIENATTGQNVEVDGAHHT